MRIYVNQLLLCMCVEGAFMSVMMCLCLKVLPMSTTPSITICEDHETPFTTTGNNSCWEWVTVLPREQNANLNADFSSTNKPVRIKSVVGPPSLVGITRWKKLYSHQCQGKTVYLGLIFVSFNSYFLVFLSKATHMHINWLVLS